MVRSACIFFVAVLLFHASLTFSQENTPVLQEAVMPDTTGSGMGAALDTFIINHKPLTTDELNTLRMTRSFSVYGEFINEILKKGHWYKLDSSPQRQLFTKRKRQHEEWLFYTFAGLFFFIGLINARYSDYLTKLIRGYVNEGFIFFQVKEQLSQYPIASLLMNLFFFIAATFFIFFGLSIKGVNFPVEEWEFLIFIFLTLVLVYLTKFIFLAALGWVFNQQDVFKNYTFIIFLNNKIMGLLLFLFSFLMAFAQLSGALTIGKIAVVVLAVSFLFRFFKGFSLLAKQAKLSLFSFTLAVLSLEILPTAVLIKFLSSRFVTILTDIIH